MVLLAIAEKSSEVIKIQATYLLLAIGLISFNVSAQLKTATIFSDHMLLQRDEPIIVWGKALPDEEITVLFSGLTRRTITSKDSTWKVVFPKQPANSTPQHMLISNPTKHIEIKDILIGDIWLCIGQSNMEWPMHKEQHWSTESSSMMQPNIRFINPPPAGRNVFGTPYTDSLLSRLTPADFYAWNGWKTSNVHTIDSMSAVGYYFAKEVHNRTQVPIGIINLSIGGAPLETFIDLEPMRNDPRWNRKTDSNWLSNGALPVWIRERARQNLGMHHTVAHGDVMGPNHAYKPGFAYASGILPLQSLSIKGVLVYQGESNAEEEARVMEYADLFKLLVKNYRELWNNARLPVYWVQLSSTDRPLWPMFRNIQRELLGQIKYSGMAVSSDIGLQFDVHPRDKKTVGHRLARWALYKNYHVKELPSGPLPRNARYKNGTVVIRFKYTGRGLMSSDGARLREFSVDGTSPVSAVVLGKKVGVTASIKPEYIFYGWEPFSKGNLVNSELLPASTFRVRVK